MHWYNDLGNLGHGHPVGVVVLDLSLGAVNKRNNCYNELGTVKLIQIKERSGGKGDPPKRNGHPSGDLLLKIHTIDRGVNIM